MTNDQKTISRKYLVYRFFSNFWFMSAVWLYLYRLFITDQQTGILDGIAFTIGLLAEVPSGVLADKFGRAKMVKIGQVFAGSGFLIQAFGSSFFPFFIGQSILMIGIAFISGADEALFFDKLKFSQKSTEWRKLLMRGSQIATVTSLVTTVLGGWLYTFNPRIPWILTGLSFFISIFPIWSIRETNLQKNRHKLSIGLKKYWIDIRIGFEEFSKPNLLLYLPIIIILQGLFYTFGWGLLKIILLDRFHFDSFGGSVVIALSSLTTFVILAIMHKYSDNLNEKKVIVFVALIAIISLLLSLINLGSWGYFVILILYAGEHIFHPFMSEILNNNAPENTRATILSVGSFLRTLPYILLAPIIGYLNTHNNLGYFFVIWSLLIFGAILFYLILKKKDSQIKLTTNI